MTSNYLDSDAAVLCSYSLTIRNLFLSMNAYHYPCAYKPVFYNQAYLSLLDCDTDITNMQSNNTSVSSKRSRATKCHKNRQNLQCSAMKIDGIKTDDQLHWWQYYVNNTVWPEQFLEYDTSKGRTNSMLSPWNAENPWDSDDLELMNRSLLKKKDRLKEGHSPHSSRSDVTVQTILAPSAIASPRNEKRKRSVKERRILSQNNSNVARPIPFKIYSKSINGWILPNDPQNIPTPELVVPFEHDLSWIQYAYKYRERKGLAYHGYPQHDKNFHPQDNTMMSPSKSDFQKNLKKSSIDLEVPLRKTDRICISDRQPNPPKGGSERVTLKGNIMHLHLPGNKSPEIPARKTSSDHKRLSLKGSNVRNELNLTFNKSKTSITNEGAAVVCAYDAKLLKSSSLGLVTVCRSRPTIPSNLHGRLCVTSQGTPTHEIATPKSAGKRPMSYKGTYLEPTKPTQKRPDNLDSRILSACTVQKYHYSDKHA